MNGSNSENDIELTATRPLGAAVPSVHAASKPNGGFEGTTVQSWWSILVAEEDPADPLAVKVIQEIEDWVVSLFIGFFVVSYWRGTWTLLDIWGCDQPQDASLTDGNTFCLAADPKDRLRSAWITYLCGIVLTFLGVAWLWTGFWHPRASADGKVYTKIRKRRMVARFVIVYTLGMAAVCQWRGIWYLTDDMLKDLPLTDGTFTYDVPMPLASWWLSAGCGVVGAALLLSMASLLAPPAIFLLDGPSVDPPPIGVTALSSYYSLTAPCDDCLRDLPTSVEILDAAVSFLVIPWFVVWYWRGCWLLCDYYLWRFSPDDRDLHNSLGYSAAIAMVCYALTCETTVGLLNPRSRVAAEVMGRLRTFVLAFGTVNFWRIVWYVWDDFLPGPTTLSSALSHVIGIVVLLSIGCTSSILAPASTLGVDAIPHPDCAEEPLFGMLPITTPTLFLFAIGRRPLKTLKEQPVCEEEVDPKSLRETSFLEMQRPNLSSRQIRQRRPSLPTTDAAVSRPPTARPALERQASMRQLKRPVLKRRESFYFRNR